MRAVFGRSQASLVRHLSLRVLRLPLTSTTPAAFSGRPLCPCFNMPSAALCCRCEGKEAKPTKAMQEAQLQACQQPVMQLDALLSRCFAPHLEQPSSVQWERCAVAQHTLCCTQASCAAGASKPLQHACMQSKLCCATTSSQHSTSISPILTSSTPAASSGRLLCPGFNTSSAAARKAVQLGPPSAAGGAYAVLPAAFVVAGAQRCSLYCPHLKHPSSIQWETAVAQHALCCSQEGRAARPSKALHQANVQARQQPSLLQRLQAGRQHVWQLLILHSRGSQLGSNALQLGRTRKGAGCDSQPAARPPAAAGRRAACLAGSQPAHRACQQGC